MSQLIVFIMFVVILVFLAESVAGKNYSAVTKTTASVWMHYKMSHSRVERIKH